MISSCKKIIVDMFYDMWFCHFMINVDKLCYGVGFIYQSPIKKLKKLQLDFTKFSLQLVEKLTQYAVLKYEEQEDFQNKL